MVSEIARKKRSTASGKFIFIIFCLSQIFILMEASRVIKSSISFIFVENHYLEKTGEKECLAGSKVARKSNCASACGQLKLVTDETLFGGTCFARQDLKCRMQKYLPSENKPLAQRTFRLICKLPGNWKYCWIASIEPFS